MPRVSQQYSLQRRDQILNAASSCFAREGFHGTSMQAICVEANLSPGAVYGYFPSKEDLVLAIAEQVLDRIIPELEAATRSRPLPPLHDTLGRVFNTLGRADNDRILARLAVQVWAEAVRNPTLATRLSKGYRTVNSRLVALIAAYQRQGDIGTGTSARDVARLLTMLGPAFLLHRALLSQSVPGSFTAGLYGLLATHDAARPGQDSDA